MVASPREWKCVRVSAMWRSTQKQTSLMMMCGSLTSHWNKITCKKCLLVSYGNWNVSQWQRIGCFRATGHYLWRIYLSFCRIISGISMIFRRFCFNRINFLFTINSTEKDNVKNKEVKTDKFHWYRQQNYYFFLCELFHANFFFIINCSIIHLYYI